MGEIAPEGQPVEPEAPAEEAPWTGPSQEDWQATQEALQALTPLAQQWQEWQNQPDEPEEPGGDYDPFDPESVRALVQQETAAYRQYIEEQQMAEAEERASDIIRDAALRDGDFLFPDKSPAMARARANDLIGSMQQKYGFGPKAAEAALEQAVKDVREWEQAVGKAYHDRQVNQLSTLGQARREPGAAGNAASDQLVTPESGDEMAIVRSFFGAGTGA